MNTYQMSEIAGETATSTLKRRSKIRFLYSGSYSFMLVPGLRQRTLLFQNKILNLILCRLVLNNVAMPSLWEIGATI
jgi:hypothetical protein